MKYWQLTSILRSEEYILKDEFKKENWVSYLYIFENLELITKIQERKFLDKQIDDVLLKDICKKSKKKVYLSTSNNILYNYKNEDTDKEFTLLEAIELFDHDVVEEVFEKSSSIARERAADV